MRRFENVLWLNVARDTDHTDRYTDSFGIVSHFGMVSQINFEVLQGCRFSVVAPDERGKHS